MIVYCIPGLAADSRVFKNINLPAHCKKVCLEWITPERGESLQHYSQRLGSSINTSEPFALIGLSMGGMIAVELAEHLSPAVTILISSVPVTNQLPPYYHWAGKCRLHKAVPIKLLQQASLLRRMFTTETSEAKSMLKDMIRKSDPRFIRWALHAILSWKKDVSPAGKLVQVHGSRDFILPVRYTKPTHIIKGAGHLMVMTRAKAINEILEQEFSLLDEKIH
jgi:pimeloyl-ACP methyl ester carboxylesterase